MPLLQTQISALVLAFVAAWGLSRIVSYREQHSLEEGQPSTDRLFRKGARRMAIKSELGTPTTYLMLVFRAQQVSCFVLSVVAVLFVMRPKAAMPLLFVSCLPFLVMYGMNIPGKPTLLIAPPDFSLVNVSSLSVPARFHLLYSMALYLVAAYFVSWHCNPSQYKPLGTPFDNRYAWLSLAFQGQIAQDFVMCWGKFYYCSLAVYIYLMLVIILFGVPLFTTPGWRVVPLLMLSPYLLCAFGPLLVLERFTVLLLAPLLSCRGYNPIACMRRGAAGFPLSSRILEWLDTEFKVGVGAEKTFLRAAHTLTEDILSRTRRLTYMDADGQAQQGAQLVGQAHGHVMLPEKVKPVTFITWLFKRIPMPGELAKDLAVFFGDIFTDTYSWICFLRKGHVMFAGFLAAVAWTSTLIQLNSGMFRSLFDDAAESAAAGVQTINLISLLDTEKGLESMMSFIVQGYGFVFSGLKVPDILVNFVGIALSFLGIATYVMNTCDLDLSGAAATSGGGAVQDKERLVQEDAFVHDTEGAPWPAIAVVLTQILEIAVASVYLILVMLGMGSLLGVFAWLVLGFCWFALLLPLFLIEFGAWPKSWRMPLAMYAMLCLEALLVAVQQVKI